MPFSFFTNRTRQSGDLEFRDLLYSRLAGGTVSNISFPGVPQWTVIDDMSDVAGKQKRKDGRYNPSCVYHNHVAMRANAIASGPDVYGGHVAVYGLRYPVIDLSGLSSTIPMPSDSAIRTWAEDAFFEFSTQIPTMVSIPNFLYELREVSSLLPKLEKSIRQTAAGGYLNFSFGWKPFLGDLETLVSLVGSIQSKIQHLKETYGKRTRLSKSWQNVIGIPLIRDYINDSFTAVGRFPLYMTSHRTDVRANGFLFHLLEGLDSLGGLLRAFAAALGLNNPLKVFWEAIPYSFVLDWITRIGHRLDAFTANPFQGEWQISDCTFSIKSTTIFDVYQRNDLWGTGDIRATLGSIRYDRFVRYNYLPIDLASFNLVEMNPQQLALYLALLAK